MFDVVRLATGLFRVVLWFVRSLPLPLCFSTPFSANGPMKPNTSLVKASANTHLAIGSEGNEFPEMIADWYRSHDPTISPRLVRSQHLSAKKQKGGAPNINEGGE